MLKALRHKGTQKNIFIALVAALVLSFAVSMLVLSKDDKGSFSSLATLSGHKISTQNYLDSYRAVQHQIEWMYGDKLAEMKNRINVRGEAWDRLLLLDYAQKQKIRASDTDVVQWITSQEAFKHKEKFDQKYYEMYIDRGLRSTPRALDRKSVV